VRIRGIRALAVSSRPSRNANRNAARLLRFAGEANSAPAGGDPPISQLFRVAIE
jgi:hypothetical protein